MSGGLVQITNYGSHDIMLTNNPEITFFRTIFRRYSNFGKIFVETKFDNPVDFDSTIVLNIPKAYDLLSNLILKITLPNLKNETEYSEETENTEIYFTYYKEFLSFKNQLLNIVNNFFKNISTSSTTYIKDLDIFIMSNMTESQFITFFEIVDFYLGSEIKNIEYYKNASLYKLQSGVLRYIYDTTTIQDYNLENFKNLIYANMNVLDELNVIMYNILINKNEKKPTVIAKWINKVAIYMFEYFEIDIGSNQIVKLPANYVDMYGQLTYENPEVYNAMINDINNNPSINKNFLGNQDGTVYLKVPFWFCQNYGLSFPLISLMFNDLQFKIKTKRLVECVDIIFTNTNPSEIVTQEYLNNLNNYITSELKISVLLEYASLDGNERQKFVQSGHEYLITQVQDVIFNNVSPFNSTFDVNMFHCIKDLYWNIIKEQNNFFNNFNGDKYFTVQQINQYNNQDVLYINYLNIMYDPFVKNNVYQLIQGLNKYLELIVSEELTNEEHLEDIGNVLTQKIILIPYAFESSIVLNSVTLINQPYNYFNYVQTYSYYNSIPQLGSNVYSFSLYPNDVQPSGSCNIGRIPKVTLNLNLIRNDNNNNNQEDKYTLRLYGTNYNVLRIIGGICGLAYQY